MNYISTVVQHLDIITIACLMQEVGTTGHNAWGNHFDGQYEVDGALRHGKTCWLRKVDRNLKLEFDRTADFPKSKFIIDALAKTNNYGRAYWHSLLPGQSIDRHTDNNLGFSEKVLHRYHVYLDIPAGAEIIIDGSPKLPHDLENSILDFNMYLPHSYNNTGATSLTFMVVDILRPGIIVY